ncbi:MAG: DUF2949 domain-containing protein [Trichocoleus desertorum ATA4-8-CV12]|jgi:hypothetical protein|nr:DUF2949 domain-containing protein [Trichocoleus desertorum ATA4-8-CV12]
MEARNQSFIRFLQEDLAIPAAAVMLAWQHSEFPNLLPMMLWQYGLVTLSQLDQIFDWLEQQSLTLL